MELKTTLNFEVTKNDRTYRVYIPLGAPYGEAYDAVFSCLEGIVDLQKKGVEQLKSQAQQEVTSQLNASSVQELSPSIADNPIPQIQ